MFPSRTDAQDHISTRQYARLVGDWVETGAPAICAVQILLGHTKLERTVRYLGMDAEDALSLSAATEV